MKKELKNDLFGENLQPTRPNNWRVGWYYFCGFPLQK